MQAVILCGGLATRLPPARECPKAMIDIAGKPFLDHQLALLRGFGINDIVLCVGHLSKPIRDYFGDGAAAGMRVRYSDEGARLMGTAGALKGAEALLDRSFFVLDGDSYLPLDYGDMARRFAQTNDGALMAVYKNEGRYDKSNTAVANGKVTVYDRSGKTSGLVHVHAGASVLSKDVLSLIPADRPSAQDELWSRLIEQGRLRAYEIDQRFYEIGSLAGLEEFRELMKRRALK